MINSRSFWEQVEQVEHFAARPPDKRLVELLKSYQHPNQTRALDLGCAGGRNAILLAEQGFDFYALDSSSVMVEKTRERVAAILGKEKANSRVHVGKMQNLQGFNAESFHLVIALGVYHNATNRQGWDDALKETARVLKEDGQVLVANFSPASEPNGKQLCPMAGEPHVYKGFGAGPMFLLEAEKLDAEMAGFGLLPVVPTETVKVRTESGHRVTVNALYCKG